MNKLTEILKAWAISIKPTKLQEEKAKARLGACLKCPFMVEKPFLKCRLCGCPLQAKIYTPKTPEEGNCPADKWIV